MKPAGPKKARPVRMFVSYSHENATWCKRPRPVLKVKANVDTLQATGGSIPRRGRKTSRTLKSSLIFFSTRTSPSPHLLAL
jgi:hypothetical protein